MYIFVNGIFLEWREMIAFRLSLEPTNSELHYSEGTRKILKERAKSISSSILPVSHLSFISRDTVKTCLLARISLPPKCISSIVSFSPLLPSILSSSPEKSRALSIPRTRSARLPLSEPRQSSRILLTPFF